MKKTPTAHGEARAVGGRQVGNTRRLNSGLLNDHTTSSGRTRTNPPRFSCPARATTRREPSPATLGLTKPVAIHPPPGQYCYDGSRPLFRKPFGVRSGDRLPSAGLRGPAQSRHRFDGRPRPVDGVGLRGMLRPEDRHPGDRPQGRVALRPGQQDTRLGRRERREAPEDVNVPDGTHAVVLEDREARPPVSAEMRLVRIRLEDGPRKGLECEVSRYRIRKAN